MNSINSNDKNITKKSAYIGGAAGVIYGIFGPGHPAFYCLIKLDELDFRLNTKPWNRIKANLLMARNITIVGMGFYGAGALLFGGLSTVLLAKKHFHKVKEEK